MSSLMHNEEASQGMPLESIPAPTNLAPLPPYLLGVDGLFRDKDPSASMMIEASNDLEAVTRWLDRYQESPKTLSSYRTTVERLILWCAYERGLPLSSLSVIDLTAYQRFLANPQPADRWICRIPGRMPRTSRDWRPFKSALSLASRRTNMATIKSLFGFLSDSGYLTRNAAALLRNEPGQSDLVGKIKSEHFLSEDEWSWLIQHVERWPQNGKNELRKKGRTRWVLVLAYLSGARRSEMSDPSNTMGSFQQRRRGNVKPYWVWTVKGKGSSVEEVIVSDELMDEMAKYRQLYELSPRPEIDEPTPLVLTIPGTKDPETGVLRGVQDQVVYNVVCEAARSLADEMRELDRQGLLSPSKQDAINHYESMSTHWLRHTAATHMFDRGADARIVQRQLRHKKMETTAIYSHVDDAQRRDAVERHRV